MSKQTVFTVFISYSHDSEAHREKVLALSERLRADGIVTILDQYVNGSPPEGWPRWMLNGLDAADSVIVVCTETYYRRFRGHEEPGKGKGVDWEGALITQEIYDSRSRTLKFVPVFLSAPVEDWIPDPLRSGTHYSLISESTYKRLYDFLLAQAGVEPGPVGALKTKSRPKGTVLTFDEPRPAEGATVVDISRIIKYAPAELVGREAETKLLSDAWEQAVRGESKRRRVLTFVALGGEGKTSLVAKWAAELAHRDWPGCDAVFAWSFYSQGTREQTAASSDAFLAEALTFFGDPAMAGSAQGAFDKGRRLARLVGERRALLVLDGLEPLQYAPGPPMDGKLKDDGISELLKGLAATSLGLCVVTTRYSIPDLRAYWQTTAPEVKLLRLSREAGVHLLKTLGVNGTAKEFATLVENVRGHALMLTLLGTYLRDAHGGDIRKHDQVGIAQADAAFGSGHAFRLLAAYERHLSEQFAKAVREDIKSKSPSVFLSHASEDKDSFARPLATALRQRGLDVWYDEFILKLGDSIRGKIDRGLADCDFAVAILSEHFFRKPWPQQEVSGLTAREVAEKRKIILPIWHEVDLERVMRYSPLLADRLAASSSKGVDVVAEDILGAISPQFESTVRVQRSAELMLLRLYGLFDGPVSYDLLRVILEPPEIPDLTEGLFELPRARLNQLVHQLQKCSLIYASSSASSDDVVVDLHPLVREYFSIRLKEECLTSFEKAHGRLFEHFRNVSQNSLPDSEDITPLYRAVIHGCQAGRHQEARDAYVYRIQRGGAPNGNLSTRVFGSVTSQLGMVACFFEAPWRQPVKSFSEEDQAWLLNEAAWLLRAVGRLREAFDPMRMAIAIRTKKVDWVGSAVSARNLSELELTLGEVAGAVRDAEQSVSHADRSGDALQRIVNRCTFGDALHQADRRTEADARFREAEAMQAEWQFDYPLLYLLPGFRYCDLLLSEAERAAWQVSCSDGLRPPEDGDAHRAALQAISKRAARALQWAERNNVAILDIALNYLTLGRAALYAAILEGSSLDPCRSSLQHAVAGLRRAGMQDHLPRGLLTRAWLRSLTGPRTGPESAQSDLDEAWEIAERGPMKLHMADIHLQRARLFFREAEYPWGSPAADLAAARKLIETCGYGRRKEELEDAERAIGGGGA